MPVEPEIQTIRDRPDLIDIRAKTHDYPNVHGTGIGYRISNGVQTDNPAILVYVWDKQPESALDDDEVLPDEIHGVSIDVFESRPREERAPLRDARLRPLIGGMRPARYDTGGVGSVGWGLIDPDGERVMITNGHVTFGSQPPDPDPLIGAPMYQPLRSDTGDTGKIGVVKDFRYRRIDGSREDWASISLDNPEWFTNQFLGFPNVGEVREPSFRDHIIMTGAAPTKKGIRQTKLLAVDAFSGGRGPNYHYVNTTASGDSGSILGIVDPETGLFHPVALHYIGGSYGFMLNKWFDRFSFEIDDETYSLPTPSSSIPTYFEGTIVTEAPITIGTVVAHVVNASGTTGTQTVAIKSIDGAVIDSQQVSLAPLEHTFLTMSTGGETEFVYDTGSVTEDIYLFGDQLVRGIYQYAQNDWGLLQPFDYLYEDEQLDVGDDEGDDAPQSTHPLSDPAHDQQPIEILLDPGDGSPDQFPNPDPDSDLLWDDEREATDDFADNETGDEHKD